jgi:protein regulator of cytokinesis 1
MEFNQLRNLASALLEMWNLMDTPVEEQQLFQNVTSNIAASEPEIIEHNMLSVNYLSHVRILELESLSGELIMQFL